MDLSTEKISRLITKVASLQEDYVHKDLSAGLEMMRAALEPMDQVPRDQLTELGKVMEHVRELSYDMEHVIDTILLCVQEGLEQHTNPARFRRLLGKMGSFFSMTKAERLHRKRVGRHIEELLQRAMVMQQPCDLYRVIDLSSILRRHAATTTRDVLIGLPHYWKVPELVGSSERRDVLIGMLSVGDDDPSNNKIKALSVVGHGGLGKTALALTLYQELRPQYDCAAIIHVGQYPDLKKVLINLLLCLDTQRNKDDFNLSELDEDQLIEELREFLANKRYFLVFDDLWDSEIWKIINTVLIENSNGSAVLTTSRTVDIAEDFDFIYRLQPLSDTDSRKLFYKTLFGSEVKCPSTLADISEKLIAKCGGIPLAIIAQARLLASKPLTMEDWHAVYDSFGYEFEQGPDSVRGILSYSYNDLPAHLRSCLLYLSMFQKGYEISGERLVCCWIAEDFIPETGGQSLQEVGECYLNELINRNLIEPVDVGAGGKILSCRVHDLVHQLIISLSTEDNFVTILDGCQGISLPHRVWRLSIHGNSIQHSLSPMRLSHVRSLVVSGDTMPSLSDFHGLRVLDLGGCDSLQDDHLKGIEKSLLLKYLAIGGKRITGIPKQIASLKLLQTLDLRASCLKELPESVFQVRHLQRLWVKSDMKIPVGIAKMEALQELGDINISKPELLKELRNLTKLRVLRIAIWSWNESLKNNDESLMSYDEQLLEYLRSLVQSRQSIQSLFISTCCSLDFLNQLGAQWSPPSLEKLEIQHSIFYTSPGWMCSLQNLSSLSIEIDKLSQEIVDILGKLHNLCFLSLTSKYAAEGKFGVCTDGFQKLTSFYLASNAMGKIFAPESAAMKMLKRVKLSFQASRTKDVNQGFDFGLEDLCSLKHVDIEIICFNVSRRVVENAEAAIREALSRGCSRYPNLEIRRVREESMIEDVKKRAAEGNEEVEKRDEFKQEDQIYCENAPTKKEKGIARKKSDHFSLTQKPHFDPSQGP
ncbi:disease resistance protein RGA5-like [Phragmites australis]|uniref:disease resistance protein RGA5-like n=1 Tax=Phragmites australis TaxID=29695 RepID=UPI002D795CB4|nr:disease resistance protein RGA5-like [Phragmites australis]